MGVLSLQYSIINLSYPIKGPHQEYSDKRVKTDTLFKAREPQKPYPIPRDVPR